MKKILLILSLFVGVCFGQTTVLKTTNAVITHNNQIVEFTSFTYDSSALAYFARMTTPPSTEFKDRVNTFIIAQKASGLWDKKAVIVYLGAETSQAATLNMKGDYNNATFVGTPTWLANDGVICATGYINSNFNPTTHGGTIYTQDNAGVLVYVKTDIAFSRYDIVMGGTAFAGLISRQSTLNRSSLIMNDLSVQGTTTNGVMSSIGIFQLYRTQNDRYKGFINGLGYAGSTKTINSTGLPNENCVIGSNADLTSYTGRKYGYYEIGAGLTDDEALTNYNQIKVLVQYNP